MKTKFRALILGVIASLSLSATETPDFAKHIFPLFQEHCLDCHGKQEPEGGLVMEDYASLMKGGETGAAILPGKANDSLLVKFLEGRSGKEGKNQFMPPGKKKHLEPAAIALIKAWIDAGASAPSEPVSRLALINIPKIAPQPGLPRPIHSLAVSPDGKLLAVGRHGAVELLDAATRQVARTLGEIQGSVTTLAFSADGKQLFAASGDPGLTGEVSQWNLTTGKRVRSWEAHPDAIYGLALSPDGKVLATASYDQRIKLWNSVNGELIRELKGHNGAVFGVAFRKDGLVLASASADRTVKLWDAKTGARLDTLSQPTKEVYSVAFCPDGRRLAAGGDDNRIRVWQISDKATEGGNKLLHATYAHEGAVLKLAYSSNGKTLMSAAADRSVKLWNATAMTENLLLEKQPDWAAACAFSGTRKVFVGRLDGSLNCYDTSTGKTVAAERKSADAAPIKKAGLVSAANRNGVFAQATKKKTTAKKTMAAPAKMSGPVLSRLEPAGVQRGVASEVKLVGKNLAAITGLKFSDAQVKGEIVSLDPSQPDEATVRITADGQMPRTAVQVSVVDANGESGKVKLQVDDLPQMAEANRANDAAQKLVQLPVGIWGALVANGEKDDYEFTARAGQVIVCDLEARRIGSKAATPSLQLLNAKGAILASNYGMENNTDPLLVHHVEETGTYVIRVGEVMLDGSADHTYHLTVGELPYVTGFHPLSATTNTEASVSLIGYNLPGKTVTVNTAGPGRVAIPLEIPLRFRGKPELLVTDGVELSDVPARGKIPVPGSVNGRLLLKPDGAAEESIFTFTAKGGETLVLETLAARADSPADTKIEVLFPNGEPVPRLKFQAMRDSWINFRKQEANNPGVRIANWEEMDLKQFVWFNGDIQRVFRMPRGPDADMLFFSSGGKRRAWFDTTATSHALDDPCYVVEPRALDAKIVPNGLPVFTLNYVNDDDGDRELGADSRLLFTAPADGDYLVRVSDTRGLGGERFVYRLTVRPAQPDFSMTLNTTKLAVDAGAGSSFGFKLDRMDGFDGPVRIEIAGLPPGFTATTPVVIEPGQLSGEATLFAAEEAVADMVAWKNVRMTAAATIGGGEVWHPIKSFTAVTVEKKPAFQLAMEPGSEEVLKHEPMIAPERPLEITITPGGTVSAMLRVVRHNNTNLINLDVDGLPFGIIVDNIGLNGVQIRPGENEREVFLTAAPWVEEQEAMCFAVTQSARNDAIGSPGTQTSFPVLIRVRKPAVSALTPR